MVELPSAVDCDSNYAASAALVGRSLNIRVNRRSECVVSAQQDSMACASMLA